MSYITLYGYNDIRQLNIWTLHKLFAQILLWTVFTYYSGVSVVDFERVDTGWVPASSRY